jgi:hypothetical protein
VVGNLSGRLFQDGVSNDSQMNLGSCTPEPPWLTGRNIGSVNVAGGYE